MAMNLEALRCFVRVAELGSFTQAAAQLALPKARVSVLVQQLEAELRARLLHRTTRRVRLTPDGEHLLERARAFLTEADELQGLFLQPATALRGRLRVDLPQLLARDVVLPQLPAFLARHPALELALSSTDRRVDVVHEGFDCVLRVGALTDSGLVARRLGVMRQLTVASPAYLQHFGVPQELADLAAHRLVHYAPGLAGGPPALDWLLADDRVQQTPMTAAITVNSTEVYQAACLAGLGLIQAPALGLAPLLAQGRLVPVLTQHVPPSLPVSLLYPHRHHLPQRARVFMDWLSGVVSAHLSQDEVASGGARSSGGGGHRAA